MAWVTSLITLSGGRGGLHDRDATFEIASHELATSLELDSKGRHDREVAPSLALEQEQERQQRLTLLADALVGLAASRAQVPETFDLAGSSRGYGRRSPQADRARETAPTPRTRTGIWAMAAPGVEAAAGTVGVIATEKPGVVGGRSANHRAISSSPHERAQSSTRSSSRPLADHRAQSSSHSVVLDHWWLTATSSTRVVASSAERSRAIRVVS